MKKLITKQEAIAIHKLNGEPTMSSLRIAEVTGKDHFNVARDIKNIFKECEIDVFKFEGIYLDDLNRKQKYYLLPEREFNLIVSGYSAKYRMQLIDELMEYRKKNLVQDSYQIEDPVKRAERWIEEQKEKQLALEAKDIAEKNRDKLIHQNKTYTSTELAHELGMTSAIAFNKMLNKDKIIRKVNQTWTLYAKYETLGLTDIKQTELDNGKIVYSMHWTGIGRDFIIGTYLDKAEKQKKDREMLMKLINKTK